MTLEFEEKELELATNSKGDHPLDLFLKGDAEIGGGDFKSSSSNSIQKIIEWRLIYSMRCVD